MIIQGKEIAQEIEMELVEACKSAEKQTVCFIMFGQHKPSEQFMNIKAKVAERIGMISKKEIIPGNVSTEEAVRIVEKLSSEHVDGIVVQLPLPDGIDTPKVLNAVPPHKDIDVLGDTSVEKYRTGRSIMVPPIARAVSIILNKHNIVTNNKNVLIIGKGRLVGQPVAYMFDVMQISYTTIDAATPEHERLLAIQSADIIISGAGVPHMIKPHMVKEGVVLIDAGTSEQNGEIVGDIDPSCAQKASLLSPTPGGVGPITVAALFLNVVQASGKNTQALPSSFL